MKERERGLDTSPLITWLVSAVPCAFQFGHVLHGMALMLSPRAETKTQVRPDGQHYSLLSDQISPDQTHHHQIVDPNRNCRKGK